MAESRRHRRAAARGRSRSALAFVTVLALVIGATVVVVKLTDFELRSPFSTTRREHPNAVVLAELRDQSRYVAATGRYQTILDVQVDVDWVPGVLSGSREIFVAEGDVDGWVDLSGLTEDAIDIGPDGDTITVRVPPARLSDPRIDPAATRLVSRERGLVDRMGDALGGGDPTNQQFLYQRASEKISEAAARSELSRRTEENTATFLRSLFEGIGYRTVTVEFDDQAADQD
jgi:hypothetical protein